MFGSYCTPPTVQFGGSVCAIGEAAIGHSPPSVSAWSLERYGQNVTASESETPRGQFVSATGLPLTGFSGIGGVNVVAEGLAMFGQTAGAAVGSVPLPVRRAHWPFCAVTGVAAFPVVPASVTLMTPNALSAMLLLEIDEAAAPTRRTPPPSWRFWLLSAWFPSGYGSLFGVGEKTLPTGAPVPCTRFDETVSPVICTEAPAVARTPSWPNSGPSVSGRGGWVPFAPLPEAWQCPSIAVGLETPAGGTVGSLKFWHELRPAIWSFVRIARIRTPDATSGVG